MEKVLINESTMSDIADAIRTVNGETTEYLPSEMADAIIAIEDMYVDGEEIRW